MTPSISLVWRRGWFLIIFILISSLVGGWGLASVVAGANGGIVVTGTADVIADDGVCTLREAVIAANRDLPSGTMAGECAAGGAEDEIMVPSGTYTFTMAGADEDESATGDLDVVGHVRIVGEAEVVINAAGLDRVFQVLPSGDLTLENLTLEGGIAPDGESGKQPTGGEDGGGILSQGTLALYSSTVRNNRSGNGGNAPSDGEVRIDGAPGGHGGGIAHISAGNLMIFDSTISNNQTGIGGRGSIAYRNAGNGGWGGDGGGLYIRQSPAASLQNGVVMVLETDISENRAQNGGNGGDGGDSGGSGGNGGSGGGIYLQHDAASLHSTEITFNSAGVGGYEGWRFAMAGASGTGGGIKIASGSVLVAEQVTVFANSIPISRDVGGHGGGISSAGLLWLHDSVLASNQAGSGRDGFPDEGIPEKSGGHGGGIYQDAGVVVLVRTTVQDNKGGRGGANGLNGAGGAGGGIYNQGGIIELQESSVIGNQAGIGGWRVGLGGHGGGLFINNSLLMTNSTIEGNLSGEGGYNTVDHDSSVGGSGGGIMISTMGVVTITQSLIAENVAVATVPTSDGPGTSGDGGGIAVLGQLTLANSTISGNRTAEGNGNLGASGDGGGIFGGASSAITLTSTTIAENLTGAINTGSTPGSGGGIYTRGSTVFDNVLLANNESDTTAIDCDGTISSLGYNLIEDSTQCTITGTTTGNILGQEPLLEELADNGGATRTHALNINSPAWDAGNCATINTDQRGYARPVDFPEYPNVGNGCDIGAFEAQGVHIDPNLIAVAEGGDSQSYQVYLMRAPTDAVTITLAITNQITVSPTNLVFNTGSWTLPQTITVAAIDDSELEASMVVRIEHSSTSNDPFYGGLALGAVEVEVQDNEVPVLPSATPSPTASNTPTAPPSPTASITPTASSTSVVTPSTTATVTPIITPSATPSVTATLPESTLKIQYLPLIRR